MDAITDSTVRELGMTAAAVARLLGITQQAVAKVAVRGEEFSDDQRYELRSPQAKRGREASVTIRAGSNNGCIGPIPFQ